MMNKRKVLFIIVIALAAIGLAACGAFQQTQQPTAMPPVRLTAAPTFPPTKAPSPTAAATLPQPTPTAYDPARQAVEDFFAALDEANYDAAAGMYSNFSLMVDGVTRGEAAEELKAQAARGEGPLNGRVLESRAFDERTNLVRVQYKTGAQPAEVVSEGVIGGPSAPGAQPSPTVTLASGSVDRTRQAEMVATNDARPTPTQAKITPTAAATPSAEEAQGYIDEWWAVRQESGQWRINRAKLIDYKTLDVPSQYTGGLTVKPRQITRYSDHLRLTMLVQNQSSGLIVLGQPNEVMATFLFGEEKIEAEQNRLVFAPLQSVPDAAIEVKGLYETYPDGVIIRQWKTVQEKPWFTFAFE